MKPVEHLGTRKGKDKINEHETNTKTKKLGICTEA
jgi:hypothetical protein